MKILRNTVALFAAIALCGAATSCSDNDSDDPVVVVPGGEEEGDDITPTEGIDVVATYYGDYNENNTGNYGLNFVTSGMEWDDFEETYLGPGELVYFELNSTLADNPDLAHPADGTYTFDAAGNSADMTFGSATVTRYDASGNQTIITVTGGTLTLKTLSNGMYEITSAFVTDVNTPVEFSYTGYIRFLNRTGEGFMSNLTSNIVLKDMTQSAILLWGETFTETSDYCSVIIAGKDYDLLENFGTSPAINLGLNVTPGSEGIPAGTYNVINAMEADDYDPFTALSGVYEPTYGGYFGNWYLDPLTEAALYTGTVEVSTGANGEYTFVIDLADGYGHKVTGTYTGTPQILQ